LTRHQNCGLFDLLSREQLKLAHHLDENGNNVILQDCCNFLHVSVVQFMFFYEVVTLKTSSFVFLFKTFFFNFHLSEAELFDDLLSLEVSIAIGLHLFKTIQKMHLFT